MKQFKSFIIKEARHILRDKRTMLILFGMPVVMMLLFGFAISTDVRNVRTAVVLSHVNHQTHKMVERLGANEYFDILYKVDNSAAAEQLIRHQKADMAIVFDRNNAIQVITDGADPNMAQMYANYATMILQSSDTSVMTQKLLFNPQMRSCYNFVPGIMGMLLMLICAMMTSISIVREKERGTMEVLLVSPIRPLMIIIAKAVPYLLLAFVILCTILLISKYLLLVPILRQSVLDIPGVVYLHNSGVVARTAHIYSGKDAVSGIAGFGDDALTALYIAQWHDVPRGKHA